MKTRCIVLVCLTLGIQTLKAQTITTTPAEKEIIELSKQKWQWMSDKNTATLNTLFNEKCEFVHLGGNDAINPFMVTEVDVKENGQWSLGQLTFSHLARPLKLPK